MKEFKITKNVDYHDLLGEEIEYIPAKATTSKKGKVVHVTYESREMVTNVYLEDGTDVDNWGPLIVFVRDDFDVPNWKPFDGSIKSLIGKEIRVGKKDRWGAKADTFGIVQDVVVKEGKLVVKFASGKIQSGNIYTK